MRPSVLLLGLPLVLSVATAIVGGDPTAPLDVAPAADAVAKVGEKDASPDAQPPKPKPVEPPKRAELDAAIHRGIEFLLKSQNKNGAWGSAESKRPNEVMAPVPGAHHAFRGAVTALCVMALLEVAGERADVAAAIDRAESWLLENLPKVKRATPEVFYNSWTHCYGIEALCALRQRKPDDAERQAKLRAAIEQQVDMLVRYETIDGGWAYYDFNAHTQRPSGSTISFVTATGLIALKKAEAAGVEVSKKLIDRAMDSMRRQRKPDFSYCYGEYLKRQPMHLVNRPAGSLGRSQVCNLAMRRWGDESVTDEVLKTWLDRLFARNLWLDIGRKRPIPHESWFMVAGYFFYYGHYYAALCIDELPAAERPFYQDHLAHVILRLQEKNGAWWDFPLYGYHEAYGTAFALMSLGRCRRD